MATSECARACDYNWTKDSTLVVVEFVDETTSGTPGFVNEGYIEPRSPKDVGIINLKCSGKLCVNEDDPLCKGDFVVNPHDESGKYTIVLYVENYIAS